MPKKDKDITILGRVIDYANRSGIAGLRVEAWDKDLIVDDLVGSAVTNDKGEFVIEFDRSYFSELFLDRRPDLFFKIFRNKELIKSTEDSVLWNVDQAELYPVIEVDLKNQGPLDPGPTDPGPTHPGQPPGLCVFGVVRNENGELLNGVTVQAFDRDLRSEQLLGTAVTNQGGYEIRYRREQFLKAEKGQADLVVKIFDASGAMVHKTPIQYNVPDELEVNVTLHGAEYKGPSEFEVITDTLMPLLENLSPLDLREDDQFQDASFLSGESGYSLLIIGTWVGSHHLAEITTRENTPLDAEVFFAFLRQGQPSMLSGSLLEDVKHPERITLMGDKVLREISNLGPDRQRSLLEKAIEDNLIPLRFKSRLKEILETLNQIRLRFVGETTIGGGKGTIVQLLELTPVPQQARTAFVAALSEHNGPLSEFWQKLEKDKVLAPEILQDVKLTFELGTLTRNHIPLVGELKKMFEHGDLKAKRELAKFDRENWKQVFSRPGPDGKPIGVPENIDGEDAETKKEQFAVILEEGFERTYPTTAFAAKLARSEGTRATGREASRLTAKTDLVRFIDNNPSFHLDRHRVDHFIAEHETALADVEDKATLVTELKTVQRVFKLEPTHKAVTALLDRNIDSAQQIYFMGPAQFMATMAESKINKIEAKRLYKKAENTYALALTLFANYNMPMQGVLPDGVGVPGLNEDTRARIATLPNLQTLFGSLDYCECTHCRSVYSPAAYFVDVMRFLGERSTHGVGINAGKNVRQVLFERRPDLGEIELSCENTNTPLPYIDLVNEILEDVVAPPTPTTLNGVIEADLTAGPVQPSVLSEFQTRAVAIGGDAQVYDRDSRGHWAIRDQQHAYRIFKTGATLQLLPTRQTFLSAAELRANPEYTNQNAYDTLKLEVFPLGLPFDLWYLQTRTYLDHLGVPQPRLLELFQQKLADDVTLSPTALQIDSALLNLTETEWAILNGSLAGRQPWEFWGLTVAGNNIPNPDNPADATTNVTGTWIEVLSKVNVMLHRSGLDYKELLQLLDMKYVNPDGSVFVFDTADANAANCDTSKFTIRNLFTDVLNRTHRFIRLWRKLGCAMWELDILIPDTNPDPNISDKRITDAVLQDISRIQRLREQTGLEWRVINSLYHGIDHDLYFDRGKDGLAIQTLYQRLFRNKLVDAVASFPPSPDQITGTIGSKVPGILAAFQIKEADLNLIMPDLGITTSANLDSALLSQIHRVAVLASTLGLTIDQFLRLKRLWGQDPFANPGATLKFIELAQQLTASDFSVFELDYLLAHRFTQSSGVALEDKAIAPLLQAIREGLQKISDDIRLKTEETKEAYVRSKLGLLPALQKDADQIIALAIIDGTWEGTTLERNALIDRIFAGVLDLVVARTKLAAIAAGLSPADQQAEVDERFDYVQSDLETFVAKTLKEDLINQKIGEAFQLDLPSANALLTGLRLPSVTVPLMQTINDGHLLDRLADGTFQHALDEANFPAIFKAYRLLHKVALMISKLKMKADEVTWWLTASRATDLGWMHPGEFPLDSAASIDIQKWVAIRQFFAWKTNLPKSDLTAFEFAVKVLDNTATVAQLAQLTSWEAADITALASAFHWLDTAAAFNVINQELRKSANLIRLADAMGALRRLGVNATRAIEWAVANPDSATAESLKQTVKAKYDLGQWQQIIKPIQDHFREQRRQALVSWLAAHPNQAQGQNWLDADGLYSYFLIDVEMSACMFTSRLKQAAGSAQLFVQRCLLNLEVDILAKTDLDPKWKQWKWMKQYRVWEANRKVFLYPENWIEPELRDEKSPFFKELESELVQNDITNDTAEQAYLNYLEKLDKVANLEIRTLYDQVISEDESVLHVFGRSRSNHAPEHYYRKRINRGRWLAWEKVELEINANHLIAGIHNRRLHLLWPQFLGKAETAGAFPVPALGQTEPITAQPNRYWELRLFWSELKKGKWTPKVLTDTFLRVDQSTAGGDKLENLQFRTRLAPQIQVRFYFTADTSLAPASRIFFEKVGKQVTNQISPFLEHIISPAGGVFYNNLIRHDTLSQYFYYNSIEETGKPHRLSSHENAITIELLQRINFGLTFSVIDSQAKAFAGDGSFGVWDPRHSYFVDYSWRTDFSYFSRAWHSRQISSFRFFIHYHPFVELFIKELNIWGIRGLLNRRIQVEPASITGSPTLFDFTDYQPTDKVEKNYRLPDKSLSYPVEDVDFSYMGAYAPYNWELFFHVPFFIANKLSANQRFEEALEWFHYIFDPTSTDNATASPDTPQQKFWITKPFFETTKADYLRQKIENIMLAIARGDAELREQVAEWRNNPFNPHLIARMRTVAYQKNVLIKYINTLIAWGDQLFRRDTIESINEATQLFILAGSVLGPRPKSIPKKVANPIKTFYQLQQEGLDVFGNALKEVENLVPNVTATGARSDDTPELPHLDVLYFCIPNNEKLLTLWDTVADRLFKIRHCMNIEGVERQLPLFEPPIDPALLVKATAAGLDIGTAISDMNAPLPLYRFTFMVQRALEICNEVKTLGNAMLAALEKRDAEGLALLRSTHERVMLDQVRLVRASQIDEALRSREALDESRKVVEERRKYYQKLHDDGWSIPENIAFGLSIASTVLDAAIAVGYVLAGGLKAIPNFIAGGSGFGGSPHVTIDIGGKQFGDAAEIAVKTLSAIATALDKGASLASTVASYDRRSADWEFQRRLAERELPQIEKQIAAADIRHQIAKQELVNQDKQIENAEKEDEYLRTKFTSQELYDWMIGQLSTVYFQSYQLAYDIAKRAERCYRYELGLTDSSYIQFGYWDGLKKGLMCGEKLYYDLKRLEAAYYEQNRREYELTKAISLSQLDPTALLKLRQNGECFVDIPEVAFDMDYPGHYFRRLKTVGLSIPCTAGPFTTVACTLTLTSNHLRKDSTLLANKYARDNTIDDPRFRDEIATIQSIATSNAQNDKGMFELNFRDERYLPFEAAGAISSWHIKLNKDFPQFDFTTISDVVIHLSYTAREGGKLLQSKATEEFNRKMNDLALAEDRRGLYRLFDLKRNYSAKWYKFLQPANPADDQELLLDDLSERLPYFTRRFRIKKVRHVELVARMKDNANYKVLLSPLGTGPTDLLPLSPDASFLGLHRAFKDLPSGSEINLGNWTLKVQLDGAADFKSLPVDAIEELFLIINYTIA